ncbi:MAG TPA: hypothetical protein VGF12_00970 [Roseateles sp.]|uniref:hypothetical protein n=1 Tax=Roseateles sp. TaxID=1971397 RepID=UPI002ED7C0C3
MSTSFLLNAENTLGALKAQINVELTKAAEPVIQRALAEIEAEMRKKLAANLVALIDRSYSMTTYGDVLTISVNRGPRA